MKFISLFMYQSVLDEKLNLLTWEIRLIFLEWVTYTYTKCSWFKGACCKATMLQMVSILQCGLHIRQVYTSTHAYSKLAFMLQFSKLLETCHVGCHNDLFDISRHTVVCRAAQEASARHTVSILTGRNKT